MFKIFNKKYKFNIKQKNKNDQKKIYYIQNKIIFFVNNKKINFFLRTFFLYLKSKFSKNRNFCKTIVYLSLVINIIIIYELNLYYYNIIINYNYIFIIFITILFYIFFFFLKKNI